jgi:L-amino acid N-acyltransferase YncA
MSIRPATPADVPRLTAIYGDAVRHGTGTFELDPPDADQMASRLAVVQHRGWPWLVHETMGVVDGFAYASQFRDRAAYAHAAETSVYVARDAQRTGIGQALLTALVGTAGKAGFRGLIAVIGDSDNAASIGLHAACGFSERGRLLGVGEKFGRRLDVVYMQRSITG